MPLHSCSSLVQVIQTHYTHSQINWQIFLPKICRLLIFNDCFSSLAQFIPLIQLQGEYQKSLSNTRSLTSPQPCINSRRLLLTLIPRMMLYFPCPIGCSQTYFEKKLSCLHSIPISFFYICLLYISHILTYIKQKFLQCEAKYSQKIHHWHNC